MTMPLEGVKVVDFAEHYFVPAAAAVLAEWGADVIKIERRDGDALRDIGHLPDQGFSYYFSLCNRNKRGIALDVETPGGREVLVRLVRDADVYITNHLPRVQRRLKTAPRDIFAVNPRIVYARGSGQGHRGIDAEAGGNDNLSFWCRAGVGYMLSDTSGQLIPQRGAIGDGPSGVALAAGILAGLLYARQTGQGIEVNTSLLNMGMWTVAPDIALTSLTGEAPQRRPAPEPPPPVPYRSGPLAAQYVTADARTLALSMTNESRYWPRACRALGLDDLIDGYPDPAQRRDHAEALQARFETVIASLPAVAVAERLLSEDCVFGYVNSPLDVLADPAVVANGYLLDHPRDPSFKLPAAPAQFDDTQPVIRLGAPSLGEHSEEILLELGYSKDHIAELTDEGTIGPAREGPSHHGPRST